MILALVVSNLAFAQAQEIDKELADLATKLANLTKENSKKKVTVIDFTDLQGGGSELGKYIAEELTVNLVMVKKDFSVLDRANLRRILAEHKLTATGLVDPENAKKLGQFAGVDALILGTITPKGQKVNLTAKIITTDTAEIVGAAKAEFNSDETVQQLLSQPASEAASDIGVSRKDGPAITKSFGDLGVILQSLRIANGKDYLLSLTVTNLNPKRSIWVALPGKAGTMGMPLSSSISDAEGYEFNADSSDVKGIAVGGWWQFTGYSGDATEIKPKDSISATINFHTRPGRNASHATCRVQLTVALLTIDGYGNISGMKNNNFMTEMKTR